MTWKRLETIKNKYTCFGRNITFFQNFRFLHAFGRDDDDDAYCVSMSTWCSR